MSQRRKRAFVKELLKTLQQESSLIVDPVIDLIHALYIDYDFERASGLISQSELLLSTDYFLAASCLEFMDSIRVSLFESYCKIHRSIGIR